MAAGGGNPCHNRGMTRTPTTVIQHLAFEDLGSFDSVLREAGCDLHYVQAGVDDLRDPILDADLLVILGGPIGVYETQTYPFLVDELAALQIRLAQDRPTLGICLGAQLMAQALGGRVYPGAHKEIGWSALTLTDAGQASPLRHLAGVPVLHWHGDTFDLPPQAAHLASSALYPHQAFQVGANLLGLQFHPEAQARTFERWLIGHAAELSAARVDIPLLRAQAAQHAPALEAAGQRMLQDWLQALPVGRG